MAFIDIKDPVKREEIVQDYIKNVKEIRERRENEKVRGFTQSQNIARVFKPVVEATEKSASKITSEIKNLKEPEQTPSYYLKNYSKSKLDQYFGVDKINGVYVMGDREIEVDENNNIILDNVSFKGTKGLWKLIMMKTPEGYLPEDFENYKELLYRTNTLENPHIRNNTDKPRNTSKWKFFKQQGILHDSDTDTDTEETETEETEGTETETEKAGEGVQFLPGDINGLLQQFNLLFAEFRAGNKSSTRNKIIAILDELLRRNYLNQQEYNAVCETLSC